MSRPVKHWFSPNGDYRNAELIGTIQLKIESMDNTNESLMDFIEDQYRDIVDFHEKYWRYTHVGVLTGRQFVPFDWLGATKEEAFQKFVDRVAKDNGLMVDKQ